MKKTIIIIASLVVLCVLFLVVSQRNSVSTDIPVLKVGIAPYQDMALLMNSESKSLQEKYNLELDLVTLAWEDLTPAISSATDSLDIAFASITEFITNERNINRNTDDPLVFIYPAYVFLGGSFVSFNHDVPVIKKDDLQNIQKLKDFLGYNFAAQKKSAYEMMLFSVAKEAGVDFKDVNIFNIGAGDGLLAAINGSVDVSSAGLTQRNEAIEQGGRVVLTMGDLGFVDIAGFVVKQSVLDEKREEITNFIKMWYDSINYVMSDIDNNSFGSIEYLNQQSSTNYTIDSFKKALEQEFFPINIDDVKNTILTKNSRFDFENISNILINYLLEIRIIGEEPQNIKLLDIN
jgi:ABC-type nitrate/sulfonate/bicarbonate transport system substrate-binding protein